LPSDEELTRSDLLHVLLFMVSLAIIALALAVVAYFLNVWMGGFTIALTIFAIITGITLFLNYRHIGAIKDRKYPTSGAEISRH
jgi:membrane protein implicated in regulation of membrane protease activity